MTIVTGGKSVNRNLIGLLQSYIMAKPVAHLLFVKWNVYAEFGCVQGISLYIDVGADVVSAAW